MQRRVASIILILAGLTLIAEPLAEHLFDASGKFEAMQADFRPVMTRQAIAGLKQNVARLQQLPGAVQTALLPAIAAQAHVTAAQLQQTVSTNYPAVASGLQAIGPITTQLNSQLSAMESQIADFQKTDAIPTKDRSTKSVPWALVAAGVVAFGSGVAMYGRGRTTGVVAIVLGALLIGVPLLTQMPSKAAASNRLNASNQTLLTTANAAALTQAVSTLNAMGTEFTTKLLPDLARQLQIPPATLAANPVVASLTSSLPGALAQLQQNARLVRDNVARYNDIKDVSFVRITWLAIGTGLASVIAGLIGMAYSAGASSLREQFSHSRQREVAA